MKSPKSDRVRQIEEFAYNKSKRAEIIMAFTSIKEHFKAEDMNSDVGSAFQKGDLDEEMGVAYDAIGEHGIIYDSYYNSFWIRHKGRAD